MAKKNISYKEAIGRIEEILQEIESDEIDVDLLAVRIKEANQLIAVCKDKLKKTDEEVDSLMNDDIE